MLSKIQDGRHLRTLEGRRIFLHNQDPKSKLLVKFQNLSTFFKVKSDID